MFETQRSRSGSQRAQEEEAAVLLVLLREWRGRVGLVEATAEIGGAVEIGIVRLIAGPSVGRGESDLKRLSGHHCAPLDQGGGAPCLVDFATDEMSPMIEVVAREVLLTVTPTARRGAVWRCLSKLLIDAAADRASMIEVEEMLLRGLNSERMV
jgi:hypothetical protein